MHSYEYFQQLRPFISHTEYRQKIRTNKTGDYHINSLWSVGIVHNLI